MYKLVSGDTFLGLVDYPRYVRRKNGVFIQCPKEEADGIAFNSQFYRLYTKDVEGYDPVDIVLVDSGEYIVSHENGIHDLNEGLTETQLALCDTYESGLNAEEDITNIQLALAEVYEMQLAASE